MIADVYLFRNGMVMTFDSHGTQIETHQGHLSEIRDNLLSDAPAETRWHIGNWGHGVRGVTKAEWVRVSREMLEEKIKEKNHAKSV